MSNLTLEEIAKRAGVSRSTVSRVINEHPNVRDEVRSRILEIIEKTGYQPNLAARSLASRRSKIIGLVIPRQIQTIFTDPYFPRLTLGITQACNHFDYTISLFLLETIDDERKLFPRISRSGLLDGVIVQSTREGDIAIPLLVENRVPFVVVGRPFDTPEASYVDVNNPKAASSAVEHLIKLGRRRIATITGPLSHNVGRDREAGYRQALRKNNLPVDGNLIIEGDFTEESGYRAANTLLTQQPDAVFAASDSMALGALRAFHEAGKRVPEEIAIVGFDDLPLAISADPHLTTVRQPIRRFGFKAVELLIDIIQQGNIPPRRFVFDTELVIRDSCGATRRTDMK
jgi:LacI family transcriptional regulator